MTRNDIVDWIRVFRSVWMNYAKLKKKKKIIITHDCYENSIFEILNLWSDWMGFIKNSK